MNNPHPCFHPQALNYPSFQRDIKNLLALGPWFWPLSDDWQAFEAACQVMETTAPPVLRPGETLLLTYQNTRSQQAGGLWVLSPQTSSKAAEFLSTAQSCWKTAARATLQALPYLWRSPAQIQSRRLQAQHIPGTPRAAALDDTSFGLSFALAIASELLDTALPADFAASATIDDRGNLSKIKGLEQKLIALLHFAPQVRRLFVAHDQDNLEELRRQAQGRIEIYPFQCLHQVLELLFPDWQAPLCRLIKDPDKLHQSITEAFELALGHRSALPSWAPLRDAFLLIQDSDPPLARADSHLVQAIISIASRHVDNQGSLPLADLDLFEPDRTRYLAHLVQNAADTGSPDPRETFEFIQPMLVRGPLAFEPHLKLLGAVGRLRAILGDHQQALQDQIEALEGWLHRRITNQNVSYPLSFAYFLAGALNNKRAISRLDTALEHWLALSRQSPEDLKFVNLMQARALLELQSYTDAEAALRSLLQLKALGPAIRTIAFRYLITALESQDDNETLSELSAQFPADDLSWTTSRPPKGPLLKQWLLLELSRALRQQRDDRAQQIVDELIEIRANPIPMLASYCPNTADLPRYINRFYPY